MSGSTTKAREPKEMQHRLICETGGEAERVSRSASGAEGDAWCAVRSGLRRWLGWTLIDCDRPRAPAKAARKQWRGRHGARRCARRRDAIAPCEVRLLGRCGFFRGTAVVHTQTRPSGSAAATNTTFLTQDILKWLLVSSNAAVVPPFTLLRGLSLLVFRGIGFLLDP